MSTLVVLSQLHHHSLPFYPNCHSAAVAGSQLCQHSQYYHSKYVNNLLVLSHLHDYVIIFIPSVSVLSVVVLQLCHFSLPLYPNCHRISNFFY